MIRFIRRVCDGSAVWSCVRAPTSPYQMLALWSFVCPYVRRWQYGWFLGSWTRVWLVRRRAQSAWIEENMVRWRQLRNVGSCTHRELQQTCEPAGCQAWELTFDCQSSFLVRLRIQRTCLCWLICRSTCTSSRRLPSIPQLRLPLSWGWTVCNLPLRWYLFYCIPTC